MLSFVLPQTKSFFVFVELRRAIQNFKSCHTFELPNHSVLWYQMLNNKFFRLQHFHRRLLHCCVAFFYILCRFAPHCAISYRFGWEIPQQQQPPEHNAPRFSSFTRAHSRVDFGASIRFPKKAKKHPKSQSELSENERETLQVSHNYVKQRQMDNVLGINLKIIASLMRRLWHDRKICRDSRDNRRININKTNGVEVNFCSFECVARKKWKYETILRTQSRPRPASIHLRWKLFLPIQTNVKERHYEMLPKCTQKNLVTERHAKLSHRSDGQCCNAEFADESACRLLSQVVLGSSLIVGDLPIQSRLPLW